MTSPAPTTADLTARRDQARADFAELVDLKLSLDLTRGKPSPAQLDLSNALLSLPEGQYLAPDGTDTRNYGGLNGLTELREIFSPLFQVPVPQLLGAGNSSLELMHDSIMHALLSPLPGATSRWVDQGEIVFLCPVPGYDRHFALCERFGITMVAVPMNDQGPDMDVVEALVAEDPRIKGIWCVPKHSNPDGTTYGDETVQRLAAMQTAAPDFRIFWDNAYALHHLVDGVPEVADVLALCEAAGHADRVFLFGSTSKVTLAGAGVAFFGSSPANIAWFTKNYGKRTIGPDKVNQLRHLLFLKDGDGVRAHMLAHRALIKPKFDAVAEILAEQLGGSGLATWSDPQGGYFVNLDVPEGCARAVVSKAAEAGIALTPAGSTHPYGDDPQDRTIRIAPTFPDLADLRLAIAGLATCVRLVGYEKLLS